MDNIAVENPPMYDFSVLRELRKREELTIAEVSERSGISAAVISKLERNQTSAELETLFKLSRVYGINAADLLGLAESRTAHKKSSEAYISGGFTFQAVHYANARCYFGHAAKGAEVSRPEIHHDDYEVCWVLKGAILVSLPNERHPLKGGESIQFDAVLEHSYEALEDCQVIILHLSKGKRF